MRLARVAVLLASLAALAGCGSSHARRDDVNAYFVQLNQAQANLLAATGEIDAAFQGFSLTDTTPAEARELRRAQTEIRRALAGVRAVDPPPEARRLHDDLISLLSLESQVAHELVWTIAYQPRVAEALSPLPAASKRLARDVAKAGTRPRSGSGDGVPRIPSTAAALNAFGAAFARFGHTARGIAAELDRMSAPPELRPALNAERRTFHRSAALSDAIATALAKQDVNAGNAAIRELFGTIAGANSAATQRAEAGAVRAYNKRLGRIAALAARVARDRQELVRAIG
jgi:hypothetical protein